MNEFAGILLEWYGKNKRDLPWRGTKDPYLVWISEIILQQTRVAQGYNYFLRFIERFPDIMTLASADEDEVLKYWQGLGYYSRARNLLFAAKSMNGLFPKTYPEVRQLKGVGDYTAAAICSISYNLPYAVVDGNVYRVLSRYLGVETPIDSTEGKKLFSVLANELLDRRNPGLYNQAIMDFGALQCTPSSPICVECPLADSCIAFQNKNIQAFPVKQKKTKVRNRYFYYLYIKSGNYIFLNKRTGKDIWENLFELPLIEVSNGHEDDNLLDMPEFKSLFVPGESPVVNCVKRGVKHVLSHQVIYADFYEILLPEDSVSLSGYLKVRIDELANYAIPRLIDAFLEEKHSDS